MTRDIDKRTTGLPTDPKPARASTWHPRPSEKDINTNHDVGAPPVPKGEPGDREEGEGGVRGH